MPGTWPVVFDELPGTEARAVFCREQLRMRVFMETLVRYGNRYQADQAAAANSLFGGENVSRHSDSRNSTGGTLERSGASEQGTRSGGYLSCRLIRWMNMPVVLEHVCNTHMS